MNEIINKLLLTGDTFMPKLRLSQPGFICNSCKSFTKHREMIQKFKET